MIELSIAGLGIKFQTQASRKSQNLKAVIIAAGRGSRLQGSGTLERPKPLVPLAGRTLLERTILTMKKAGLRDFLIVIGYRGTEIRHSIASKNLGVAIEWRENPDWTKQNGLSVLAAEGRVQGPFVLSMADHLFSENLVARLLRTPVEDGEAVLAVDRAIEDVPDLNDATKVFVKDHHLNAIGKDLANYNAIDTGLFLCTPSLFSALRKVQVHGDCSLSDGIRELAVQGRVRTLDVQGSFWLDVDTPEALALAEKRLFQNLAKPFDGFLAKHFNRPISLRVSRLLAKTSITPNQITLGLLILGVLAGSLFSQGTYWSMLGGALVFHLQSILDGCDGEIARLKMLESKIGGILDVVCDGLVTALGFWGIGQGLGRWTGQSLYSHLGTLTAILALGCTAMLFVLVKRSGRFSGSFRSFSPFQGKAPKFFEPLTKVLDTLSRRDYTYLVILLALLGKLSWFLWLTSWGIGIYFTALLVLYGASLIHEKI